MLTAVASNVSTRLHVVLTDSVPDEERIEGSDVAGHVKAVGEGVTEFKEGDKVAALTWSPEAKPTWGA